MNTVLKENLSICQKVGMRILMLRTQLGLTQSAFAKKIGVAQQEISRLEKGDNCSVATLDRIARTFDYELEVLFRRKES